MDWPLFWNAVGALGGFSSGFVVLYILGRDKWIRPILMATFDRNCDVVTQTNVVNRPTHEISRWLRVQVRNRGKSTSRETRAYLVSVRYLDANGQPGDDLYKSDTRELKWMHDHSEVPKPMNLPPNVTHWIDVCAVAEGATKLELKTYPSGALGLPGTCRLVIQVVADGGECTSITINVTWNGEMHSLSGQAVATYPAMKVS